MPRPAVQILYWFLLMGLSSSLADAAPNEKQQSCPGGAGHIVVVDLTTDEESADLQVRRGNKILSFAPSAKLKSGAPIEGTLMSVAAACSSAISKTDDRAKSCDERAKALVGEISAASGQADRRWISNKGGLLVGYVFRNAATQFTTRIEETSRSTRLATDLGNLFRIAQSLAADAGEGIVVNCFTYTLTESRANLTVEVTPSATSIPLVGQNDDSGETATPAPNRAGAAEQASSRRDEGTEDGSVEVLPVSENRPGAKMGDTSEPLKVELITGPREHWFLSVDLPVEKLSDTEVDDEGSLEPRETPTEFLIGADYMLGDLFTEDFGRKWWGGVTFKFLAEASSNPGDTLGLGVGYRFRSTSLGGLDLDMFSLFAARLRIKDSVTLDDGTETERRSYKNVVGISFNLDKALEWLGNDSQ